MSFLNPVNEPVKRFKSTDAGAPQINYNARTAGDVKAVLKACLVTGYGATASAGWTATNEVGNTIEFVSPSAAMSDYRLGIDDTSASSTTWYYQYQDALISPSGNQASKNFSSVNKTDANNGWQLLTTPRGLLFVESLSFNDGGVVCRVMYWGASKQTIDVPSSSNIAFMQVGASAADYYAADGFRGAAKNIFINGNSENLSWFGPAQSVLGGSINTPQRHTIIDSALYIANSTEGFVAQIPPFYLRSGGALDAIVKDIYYAPLGQQCLRLVLGSRASSSLVSLDKTAVCLLIPLSAWSY